MTELDIDEASAILQLIDENIQSVYQQLEGEVEAGQSVLSKMPELIIAYDKLACAIALSFSGVGSVKDGGNGACSVKVIDSNPFFKASSAYCLSVSLEP